MQRIFLIIIALVFVMGGCSYISSQNKMVELQENVQSQWGDVEVVYNRRANLIPNLVETAKAAAENEKEVFANISSARAAIGGMNITPELINDPAAFEKFQAAQGQLSSAISRLLVVQENYPELKSNQQFQQLATQLEGTENRIAVEQQKFNEAARAYNTYIKKFPGSIWAGIGGFDDISYFKAQQGADVAPQVDFSN
ncbi:MAG: LemA family protein [Bacteroidota bacterium]